MQAGSPHMPTFFSTVEVEGVEFHGKGGRSKKQSEENATKIAYIALKECKFIIVCISNFALIHKNHFEEILYISIKCPFVYALYHIAEYSCI